MSFITDAPKWTESMGTILGAGDTVQEDTARQAFFVIFGWLTANRLHTPTYEVAMPELMLPYGFAGSSSLGAVALLGTVQGWLVGARRRMTAGAFQKTLELALVARTLGWVAFRSAMKRHCAETLATKYRTN